MKRGLLILPILCAAMCGCADEKVSFFPVDPAPHVSQKPPLSVRHLGKLLDMKVERSDGLMARLSGPVNAITIFGNPNGAILVNGRPIEPAGDILQRSGELLIPADRLGPIRKAMVRRPVKSNPDRLAPPTNMTVILDAGHGGKDPGAISIRGDFEKHVNLSVASMVARRLTDKNIKVIASRRQDVFVDLDDRVALANKYDPDLFLSIHADSSSNASRRGFTVYVPRRCGEKTPAALAGAELNRTLKNVASSYGVRRHPVNLRVLEKTRCPAVLVELGYLTHRQEAARLVNPDYQQRLADAISKAILIHLQKQALREEGIGK